MGEWCFNDALEILSRRRRCRNCEATGLRLGVCCDSGLMCLSRPLQSMVDKMEMPPTN